MASGRNPENRGAEEHFKEAKEAYEVLCDAEALAYDQFGHAGIDRRGRCGRRRSLRRHLSALSRDLAARRRGRSTVFRGADLRYNLEISLEQARTFETKSHPGDVDLRHLQRAAARARHAAPTARLPAGAARCASLRARSPLRKPAALPRSGSTSRTRRAMLRQRPHQAAENPAVKIPAGVDEATACVSGEGEPRERRPAGDSTCRCDIKPHPSSRATTTCIARCRSHQQRGVAARSRSRRRRSAKIPFRPRHRARTFRLARKASRACAARHRATSLPRVVRDAGQPHRAPAPDPARVRSHQPAGQRAHHRAQGWFDKVKEFFES